MRRFIKFLARIIAAIFSIPLFAFLIYDIFVFQTRRTEIDQIIASATVEERNPPQVFVSLMRVAYPQHLSSFAARTLVYQLNVSGSGRSMAHWHTTEVLWWALTTLHLSEQDQIAIIASRSYMGQGVYGYSAAAMLNFHRNLSSLTTAEAATIVALPHSPSRYQASPERLAQRRDYLLAKVKSGP